MAQPSSFGTDRPWRRFWSVCYEKADLAGVRDGAALEALPEAERADWRALWAEVDRLLGRAGEDR